MKLDVFGLFSVEILYIMIGLAAFSLITMILAIIALVKSVKMKKKYNSFMEGSEGESIENLIKENIDDISYLKDSTQKNTIAVKDIYEKLQYTFQKIGVVTYDAFHEMGGKLSFAICMLDKNNNGYIVNVMHSNTGCFAYVKEIVKGESYLELGSEEENALKQAIAGRMGDVDLGEKVNAIINEDKI